MTHILGGFIVLKGRNVLFLRHSLVYLLKQLTSKQVMHLKFAFQSPGEGALLV